MVMSTRRYWEQRCAQLQGSHPGTPWLRSTRTEFYSSICISLVEMGSVCENYYVPKFASNQEILATCTRVKC